MATPSHNYQAVSVLCECQDCQDNVYTALSPDDKIMARSRSTEEVIKFVFMTDAQVNGLGENYGHRMITFDTYCSIMAGDKLEVNWRPVVGED